MGLFDFFKGPDINQGVKEYRESKGGILLDVRTPQEYKVGHIAGSRNIPLQNIRQAANIIKNKKTPLYVYCQSGARSGRAVLELQQMGYANAKNIGGIASYIEKEER